MYDLRPATGQLATLLTGVSDSQLKAPTPCAEYTVEDLLEHLNGLTLAFRNAAMKSGPTERGGQTGLPADWRDRITVQLDELADAWRTEDAWQGFTAAGGVDLPAELAGKIALNEVLLHGWDLACATGQPFRADPDSVRASLEFTTLVAGPDWPAGREGLFGDIVEVPADAPGLDRTLGLSGRDPHWRP